MGNQHFDWLSPHEYTVYGAKEPGKNSTGGASFHLKLSHLLTNKKINFTGSSALNEIYTIALFPVDRWAAAGPGKDGSPRPGNG
jgi:hypothetical protein